MTPGNLASKMKSIAKTRLLTLFSLALGLGAFAHSQEAKPEDAKEAEKPPAIDVGTREELKLPGLTVHTKERYVDVDATVCLGEGFLELIACTKDGKEHESIISGGCEAVPHARRATVAQGESGQSRDGQAA